LDGKVGNISLALGLGSSRKYGSDKQAWAVGRDSGLRARRRERRLRPALVRYGNFVRGSSGTVASAVVEGNTVGRRRNLAFGRERKVGQIWGVGGPVSAKIWDKILVY
jgi:hypothetical protein